MFATSKKLIPYVLKNTYLLSQEHNISIMLTIILIIILFSIIYIIFKTLDIKISSSQVYKLNKSTLLKLLFSLVKNAIRLYIVDTSFFSTTLYMSPPSVEENEVENSSAEYKKEKATSSNVKDEKEKATSSNVKDEKENTTNLNTNEDKIPSESYTSDPGIRLTDPEGNVYNLHGRDHKGKQKMPTEAATRQADSVTDVYRIKIIKMEKNLDELDNIDKECGASSHTMSKKELANTYEERYYDIANEISNDIEQLNGLNNLSTENKVIESTVVNPLKRKLYNIEEGFSENQKRFLPKMPLPEDSSEEDSEEDSEGDYHED